MNSTHFIWLLIRDAEYEEIQAMVIIAISEEEARDLAKNDTTMDNHLVDWYSEEVICLRLGISDTSTSEIAYIDFKSA
jgi:hypothetical protein